MKRALLILFVALAVGLLLLWMYSTGATTKSFPPHGQPRPNPGTSPSVAATPAGVPYRPPAGPPSLAPQATPGSQAPGLNDQEKVERLFQEAN